MHMLLTQIKSAHILQGSTHDNNTTSIILSHKPRHKEKDKTTMNNGVDVLYLTVMDEILAITLDVLSHETSYLDVHN